MNCPQALTELAGNDQMSVIPAICKVPVVTGMDAALYRTLQKLRQQSLGSTPPTLIAGYYEYADGWNDRALYIRVHHEPLQHLHVQLYIDCSKPEADAELKVSLGVGAARFMSLISPGHSGWPFHGQGVGTLLANCTSAFLQTIYPPQAVLTGWASSVDVSSDEAEADGLRERRWEFLARFGVILDDYNMFDVKIGELRVVDDGRSCLEYFPCVLPVSAFKYLGTRARDFHDRDTDGEIALWLGETPDRAD